MPRRMIDVLEKQVMGRAQQLTDVEKGQIIAYKNSGININQISSKIGRSRCAVANFLKNPGNYDTNKSPGRSPK